MWYQFYLIQKMRLYDKINHQLHARVHMVNKVSDQEINQVISLVFNDGATFKDACLQVGRHQSVMSRIIRNMGYTIPKETGKNTRKNLPTQEIINMYNSGLSELFIAKKLNVSRCAIRQRLVENNVYIRTPSEASYISAKQFTPEQRKLRASAAHKAKRGKAEREESRIMRAKTLENNAYENMTGKGELEIKEIFEARKIKHTWQKAVGRYSLDFLIGNVALELRSGTGYRGDTHKKNGRIKFLKSLNLTTIYVLFDDVSNLIANVDYVIDEIHKENKSQLPDGYFKVLTIRSKDCELRTGNDGKFYSQKIEPTIVKSIKIYSY